MSTVVHRRSRDNRRRLRSLRLLCVAVCAIGYVTYSRISQPKYSAGTGGVDKLRGSAKDGLSAADDTLGHAAGASRHLFSAASCDDTTCQNLRDDGFTSIAWNMCVYWPTMLYAFYGLAIVCDDYFVASLERISEVLKLSEDVAGATFMAAGSSAPELFTSTVDVFIFENNVGVGTIVGSAVFNILVIIALSATASAQDLLIDWKPLTRDCLFYSISIVLLVVFTETNSSVAWWEAALLVAWYMVYISFMTRNKEIFDAVDLKLATWSAAWTSRRETKRVARAARANGVDVETQLAMEAVMAMEANVIAIDDVQTEVAEEEELTSEFLEAQRKARLGRRFRIVVHTVMAARYLQSLGSRRRDRRALWQARAAEIPTGSAPAPLRKFRAAGRVVMLCHSTFPAMAAAVATYDAAPDVDDEGALTAQLEDSKASLAHAMAVAEEDTAARLAPYVEPEIIPAPLTRVEKIKAVVTNIVSKPWNVMLGYTIPNCEEDRWRRWYLVTFSASILWIGVLSWVLVEMASRIGCSLDISTVVMGLTVLAAGTSIPDALGSIVVARDGMGNMAVSNAIGSNVFDICLGIGLPYLIKTALVSPGSTIIIADTKDIEISIAILGGTVVLVWVALAVSMWRLTRTLGFALLVAYGAFIAYTLLKPSEC